MIMPTNVKHCRVQAPCKINLHLEAGPPRGDGFHSLVSVFQALDWGDTLDAACLPEAGGLELSMPWEGPPPEPPELAALPAEKNLVHRAVSLFREKTGFDRGLRIRLHKRVPPGSGFGGGSSDGAAALLALNILAGEPLSPGELSLLAGELGSDAPFFLTGGTALVRGRGEDIEALPFPGKLPVVLVRPPFSSATPEAFRALDAFRESGIGSRESGVDVSVPYHRFPIPDSRFPPPHIKTALSDDPRDWPFFNDFLPVFLGSGDEKAARYQAILGELRGLGADFCGLSGSGSGCFGVFRESRLGEAEAAASFLKKKNNFTQLTFFLAKGVYTILQ